MNNLRPAAGTCDCPGVWRAQAQKSTSYMQNPRYSGTCVIRQHPSAGGMFHTTVRYRPRTTSSDAPSARPSSHCEAGCGATHISSAVDYPNFRPHRAVCMHQHAAMPLSSLPRELRAPCNTVQYCWPRVASAACTEQIVMLLKVCKLQDNEPQ